MELTTEMLSRFVGGQLEIRTHITRCGEIATVEVISNGRTSTLKVHFTWVAWVGYDGQWHPLSNLDYEATIFDAVDIGVGRAIYSQEVIRCSENGIEYSISNGNMGMFVPPHEGPLDPNKVQDLQLVS